MPNIKFNNGKEWVDVHTNFRATETTHGVSKVATSEETLEGTNDYYIITPKKLKEVVETLPVESEVVHKDGEEMIFGQKIFSGNDNGVGDIKLNSPIMAKDDVVDSTPQFGEIEFTDKNTELVGSLDVVRGIDGSELYNAVRLTSVNGEGTSTAIPFELRNYDNGETTVLAPTPKETANGSEVITAEWINPKLTKETSDRTASDEKLQGQIDKETSDRKDEITRVEGLISSEESSRKDEITRVEGLISKEASDRTTSDENLQGQITENSNSINKINTTLEAIDGDITNIEQTLTTKQNNLTTEQLAAVNSGVTSATVTQVATNVDNINKLKESTYTKSEVNGLIDGVKIEVDDETLVYTDEDVLQAHGVIEKNKKSVKYDWVGTLEEYESQSIAEKYPEWICYITDDFQQISPETYTKTEVDSKLDLKADKANVYNKSDTYTKTEVDGLIPTIPTKVSAFENDNGYLTEHQDISNLVTKQELSTKQDTITDLTVIRDGATKGATAVQPSQLSTVATSGSYNDLSNKPTITYWD